MSEVGDYVGQGLRVGEAAKPLVKLGVICAEPTSGSHRRHPVLRSTTSLPSPPAAATRATGSTKIDGGRHLRNGVLSLLGMADSSSFRPHKGDRRGVVPRCARPGFERPDLGGPVVKPDALRAGVEPAAVAGSTLKTDAAGIGILANHSDHWRGQSRDLKLGTVRNHVCFSRIAARLDLKERGEPLTAGG